MGPLLLHLDPLLRMLVPWQLLGEELVLLVEGEAVPFLLVPESFVLYWDALRL